MRGFGQRILAASALVLTCVSSARASGHYYSWGHAYVPMTYPYCPIYLPVPYARPTPAPPSGTEMIPAPRSKQPSVHKVPSEKEPPLAKPPLGKPSQKAPTVIESRSQGGSYATAGDRCKVGFWNLTGRDVTLKINGQTRLLAKDRALTLELDRAFVWQLDQQEPASERVPDNQVFFEVVLRK